MTRKDRRKYIKERDEAFLSLDKDKILKFCAKYNLDSGKDLDEEAFWAGVHKAITAIKSAPEHMKKRSAKWLTERGYSHFYKEDMYH